jgi:hypothetical protein
MCYCGAVAVARWRWAVGQLSVREVREYFAACENKNYPCISAHPKTENTTPYHS